METNSSVLTKKGSPVKKKSFYPIIFAIIVVLLIVVGFVIYQHQQAVKLRALHQETITAAYQEVIDNLKLVYSADDKLTSLVFEIMRLVDEADSIPLIYSSCDMAMSNLYKGQAYNAHATCSLWEVYSIQAVTSQAQVIKGDPWYHVYIPIFSASTAQLFVDTIGSANDLMKTIDEEISNIEDLLTEYDMSEEFQETHDKLLETHTALKDFNSFTTKKPTDFKDYKSTATQKKTTVNKLLNNLSVK